MIRRGHLYWAEMFEDKRRPVLVLSLDARNELANDVIVVPLSTTLRSGAWHVRLAAREGGAPQVSTLKCEQISTLPKARLAPEPLGAPLSSSRMAEVERAVLRAIGIPVD
jgi:mRNA-degrading endonuclease toxin of MazEF toxin-antitoxin module